MFNIFKDMYFEASGFDLHKMKQEKIKNEQDKFHDVIYLKKSTKWIIVLGGLLYFVIGAICISDNLNNNNLISVFTYFACIMIDVLSLIFINIKSKETEILGIIGVVIFIIINMFLPMV